MIVLNKTMRSIRFTLTALAIVFSMSCAARAQCHFTAKGAKRAVTYRFQPEVTTGGLVLHVTVEFRINAEGTETLKLPNHWAGETLHALTNLRVVSKGASLTDGENADTRVVHASARRYVVITYDLGRAPHCDCGR